MGKYTTFVGMDVHARSIKASAINVVTGEVFNKSFSGEIMVSALIEWLLGLPHPLYCAYESGCTGFVLARTLRSKNICCDVIAVSTLPRSCKDKHYKCDKLDARAIRREIANPDSSFSTVWIPDEKTEAERELCRLYRVCVDDVKRLKQRLIMFCMRHGYVFNQTTKSGRLKKMSGRALDEWLGSIQLTDDIAQTTFLALKRQLYAALDELKLLKQEVSMLAERPHNKAYVDAFRQLKGIDTQTAMLAKAEIANFERFKSGRALSSWLGTVPKDSSSGGSDKHGRITKAGNKYLRRALIEGYSGAMLWTSAKKQPPKGTQASADTLLLTQKANVRLFERYSYLTKDKHKCHNKAKVAVVSELIRWIWVVGRKIELEQQRQQRCIA